MYKYSLLTFLLIFNTWSNEINTNQEYKTAYFASGCFWCVESIYENLKGVKEAIVKAQKLCLEYKESKIS